MQGAAWEPHRRQRSTTGQAAAAGQADAGQAAASAPAAEGPAAAQSANATAGAATDSSKQQAAAAQQPDAQQQAAQHPQEDQAQGPQQQAAGDGAASGKVVATAAVEVLKDDSSAMIDPAATDPQVLLLTVDVMQQGRSLCRCADLQFEGCPRAMHAHVVSRCVRLA